MNTPLQLELLDDRRARASDPDTSRAAAAHRAAPRTAVIAEIVEAAGARGATADEIGRQLSHVWRDTLRGAVCRTAKRGLIVDSGQRRASDRGGPMTVYIHPWFVHDALPVKEEA